MPKYQVTGKGFYEGKVYDPIGKRRVLNTDKPLKPVPSWLKLIKQKAETAAEKKKRLAAEKKTEAEAKEKAEQDQKDIDDASFLGEGENSDTSGNVETL